MAKSVEEPLWYQLLFCSKAEHQSIWLHSLYPHDLKYPRMHTRRVAPSFYWTILCATIPTFFLPFLACLFGIRNQHSCCCFVEKSRPTNIRSRRDAQGYQPFLITQTLLRAPWPAAGVAGERTVSAVEGESAVTTAGGRGQEESAHGPSGRDTATSLYGWHGLIPALKTSPK